MALDLTALTNAIAQLAQGIEFLQSEAAQKDRALGIQLRTAVIKEFEFTYELCFKFVRRYLEQNTPNPDAIRQLSFLDLMRTAADAGLVRDPMAFREYREKRNLSAHTYDELKAEAVLQVVDGFLVDARFVLAALESRNHDRP